MNEAGGLLRVATADAEHDLARVHCQIEHDHVLAKDDVTHENAVESRRCLLDAALVRYGQEPYFGGDLKDGAADVEEEGVFDRGFGQVFDDGLPFVVGRLFEFAVEGCACEARDSMRKSGVQP